MKKRVGMISLTDPVNWDPVIYEDTMGNETSDIEFKSIHGRVKVPCNSVYPYVTVKYPTRLQIICYERDNLGNPKSKAVSIQNVDYTNHVTLITGLIRYADFSFRKAVLIVATCCHNCKKDLVDRYKLKDENRFYTDYTEGETCNFCKMEEQLMMELGEKTNV